MDQMEERGLRGRRGLLQILALLGELGHQDLREVLAQQGLEELDQQVFAVLVVQKDPRVVKVIQESQDPLDVGGPKAKLVNQVI